MLGWCRCGQPTRAHTATHLCVCVWLTVAAYDWHGALQTLPMALSVAATDDVFLCWLRFATVVECKCIGGRFYEAEKSRIEFCSTIEIFPRLSLLLWLLFDSVKLAFACGMPSANGHGIIIMKKILFKFKGK